MVDQWSAPCLEFASAAHCSIRKPVDASVWLYLPKTSNKVSSIHGCLSLGN